MTVDYPSRVRAFREALIKAIPRTPNTKSSREALEAMPTRRLILAFITWKMRLLPARPRLVRYWYPGVKQADVHSIETQLRPFLEKVTSGADLTPHLSTLALTRGVVLDGANPDDRGKDIDHILIRDGLYHFHIGTKSASNPKGRSDTIIFAEVLEDQFNLVAISNHDAFERGTAEQFRIFEICRAYIAKDIPPGQAFMSNPVMSSGHSVTVTMFADRCQDEIERLDHLLDDQSFVATLYSQQVSDKPVRKPLDPKLGWHFEDLQFGILDRRTRIFFCFLPFFAR